MFDIGVKVICINDDFPAIIAGKYVYSKLPRKNNIYTIRDIVPGHYYNGGKLNDTCSVLLEEIVNPKNSKGTENGFNPNRFRELEEVTEKKKEYAYA